jgi:transposase
MFLRATKRKKDGKVHRYWSIVENRRVSGGGTVQKTVLYLGEINDSQRNGWTKSIEALEGGVSKQISLFPSDRPAGVGAKDAVQIEMSKLTLSNPRQWGGCWLACELWQMLEMDEFWQDRLGSSRKGTRWLNVLKVLTVNRLCDPSSEWRVHRLWYDQTAMGDLLGTDFSVASKDTLYRCLDLLLPHKEELFKHLKKRWEDLFGAKFEVLLYDLTSTYFESSPVEGSKKKYGYSRDKRPDCVQVVIALIVTPEGFPLAYEVMPGNTSDKTTLKDFLKKIETQYGNAERIWIMDRGIPTEEVLAEMRSSPYPISYLVGTPKGRLTKLEKDFLILPWHKAKESVEVKLLPNDGEVYVLARSRARVHKERAIRSRKLKKLWKRLKELHSKKLERDDLLMKIGSARSAAGRASGLVDIDVPNTPEEDDSPLFTFVLNKKKLKEVRRKEGHYLLRSNLCDKDPALMWQLYIQLTEVEEAFKNLKGDLSIRPIYHQKDNRIESHIFVSFLAYCLQVTLKQHARLNAHGLTPRSILDQLKNIQMIDVHAPTTDGRSIKMTRYTQPDKTQQLLLAQLGFNLPEQPPPKIYAKPIL